MIVQISVLKKAMHISGLRDVFYQYFLAVSRAAVQKAALKSSNPAIV
jgi:hypothetical protein